MTSEAINGNYPTAPQKDAGKNNPAIGRKNLSFGVD